MESIKVGDRVLAGYWIPCNGKPVYFSALPMRYCMTPWESLLQFQYRDKDPDKWMPVYVRIKRLTPLRRASIVDVLFLNV